MIDWKLIKHLLETMTYKDKLYKLIKAEMKRRGNWQNAPRGKAFIKGNLVQSTGRRLEQSKGKK